MSALRTWKPETLAASFALAMALDGAGPANDNGSKTRSVCTESGAVRQVPRL